MMEVYRQAEEGGLSLDEKVTVRNDFPSLVDGSPFRGSTRRRTRRRTFTSGSARTLAIRDLVRPMIVVSSNLATDLLIERVGARRVSALMDELGATGVRVRRGVEDGKAYRKGLNNTATAPGLGPGCSASWPRGRPSHRGLRRR